MIDLKNISLEKVDFGRIRKAIFVFFEKNTHWLFFATLFGIILYGGFIWYGYVYDSSWSESKKQEYMKSKDKGAIFNKSAFEGIVAEGEKRKLESEKKFDNLADIFYLESSAPPSE